MPVEFAIVPDSFVRWYFSRKRNDSTTRSRISRARGVIESVAGVRRFGVRSVGEIDTASSENVDVTVGASDCVSAIVGAIDCLSNSVSVGESDMLEVVEWFESRVLTNGWIARDRWYIAIGVE